MMPIECYWICILWELLRASYSLGIQNVKSAAYSIGKQVDRNLGKSEQEFMPDEFAVPEEKSEKPAKNKKSPER